MNSNFQDWLDELKSKTDIVSVISKYIPLNSKGRSMWGLCPFHHEKTPSFTVNPDGQFYHCFGCGVSGDAINFVKEIEGLDFIDTIKLLGERVGMQLPEQKGNNETLILKERKDKLQQILKDAANYYHINLSSNLAHEANKYIELRGMSADTVKKFGIGYSLGFNEIIDYLKSKGHNIELIYESGIAENKDNKYYDSLWGRLIFPICDGFGQVIAFGGRLLEKKDFAKYKNTRETTLFIKNKTLYGLHLVKKLKMTQKVDSIIMVEGYMDAISLVIAGFENVVASMGTALTIQQAKLLKRQVDKVYIAYDGDGAGQKATFRGLDILYTEGLDVRVVSLPVNMDPDDTIKQYGRDGFQELLDKALPLVEYKLKLLEKFFDITTLEGKGKYAIQAVRVLKSLKNNIEMEAYLEGISNISKINLDTLKAELYSAEDAPSKIHLPRKTEGTAYEIAEKYILYSMLYNKPYVNYDEDISLFLNSTIGKVIYKYVRDTIDKGRKPIAATVLSLVGKEDKPNIMDIIEFPNLPKENEEEKFYTGCINTLRNRKYEAEIKELIAIHEEIEDLVRKKEIKNEMVKIRQKIRN